MRAGFPISWLESNGWLALSGAADRRSEIRAQALSRANADGAIAYISLAGDMGDALMDDLAELGAPTGYLVDLADSDNNAIHERLRAAGMIVIEPGEDIRQLKRLMSQTVAHALKEALNHGALILFEGLAATLAGEYIVQSNGMAKGLKFVRNVYIASDVSSVLETQAAQKVYLAQPEAALIAIDRGAALVLGPNQHIETWGKPQIVFRLGSESEMLDRSI